jgi:hypothetical protein
MEHSFNHDMRTRCSFDTARETVMHRELMLFIK